MCSTAKISRLQHNICTKNSSTMMMMIIIVEEFPKSWPLCCISPSPVHSIIALLHRKCLKRTHKLVELNIFETQTQTQTQEACSNYTPIYNKTTRTKYISSSLYSTTLWNCWILSSGSHTCFVESDPRWGCLCLISCCLHCLGAASSSHSSPQRACAKGQAGRAAAWSHGTVGTRALDGHLT